MLHLLFLHGVCSYCSLKKVKKICLGGKSSSTVCISKFHVFMDMKCYCYMIRFMQSDDCIFLGLHKDHGYKLFVLHYVAGFLLGFSCGYKNLINHKIEFTNSGKMC